MENKISQAGLSGLGGGDSAIVIAPPARFRTASVWLVILGALLLGLLVAILWDPAIADDAIGENVANTILGTNAASMSISSIWLGVLFAIAAGLGTTFTACNCAVFTCIAPLAGEKEQGRMGIRRLLLWMCLGLIVVTGVYGLAGALLGNQLPSLSTATVQLPIGSRVPVRLLQSTTVFVLLGIILLIWGLTALNNVDTPWRRFSRQHPWSVPLFLGIIIGGMTVGRPFPLFHKLFQYSAGIGSPLLSAALIALQGLMNIALMSLLFVVLIYGTRGGFERWMRRNALGARTITAIALIAGGTYLIAYWGLRLPAHFGIGWFPQF